jgi:hypothetical protein
VLPDSWSSSTLLPSQSANATSPAAPLPVDTSLAPTKPGNAATRPIPRTQIFATITGSAIRGGMGTGIEERVRTERGPQAPVSIHAIEAF